MQESKVDENSLRKYLVPELIFGEGARYLAGRYARNFGARKVLVVTDPGIIAAGWTRDVLESLEELSIPFAVYSNVTPNPRAEEVMAGAELYRKKECNVIVSVGGGSPTDCAKGIGIVSSNKKHILSFEGGRGIDVPMPPLICVPTTLSSADVSQFGVITDPDKRVKVTIISKTLLPDLSLCDPRTLTTIPSPLAAATGFDALSHAIEAFVSNASSPFTDLHALEAVRLITSGLVESCTQPSDFKLQKVMMQGAINAGLAFSNAGLGIMHAIAHSLGGFTDAPHGKCNAMLLEHVVDFNFDAASDKYRVIAAKMGLDLEGLSLREQKEKLVGAIRRIRKTIGIKTTLRDLGIKESDIPQLAGMVMEDPCVVTNPLWPEQKDIEHIYEKAL